MVENEEKVHEEEEQEENEEEDYGIKIKRKNGIEEDYLFAFTLQFVDQNLQRFSKFLVELFGDSFMLSSLVVKFF